MSQLQPKWETFILGAWNGTAAEGPMLRAGTDKVIFTKNSIFLSLCEYLIVFIILIFFFEVVIKINFICTSLLQTPQLIRPCFLCVLAPWSLCTWVFPEIFHVPSSVAGQGITGFCSSSLLTGKLCFLSQMQWFGYLSHLLRSLQEHTTSWNTKFPVKFGWIWPLVS